MNCWYESARIFLEKEVDHIADREVRDAFRLMTDGDVAKFCFTDVPWGDAVRFGVQLGAHSVLRLPFPRCYFQYGGIMENALFVTEAETDDGLLWFVWRVARGGIEHAPLMHGVMTIVNLARMADPYGGDFIRCPKFFLDGAFEIMRETSVDAVYLNINQSNESNLDEAIACTAYLGFSGVETEAVAAREKVNARRKREGRPPLPSYRIVRVRGTGIKSGAGEGGGHASPAPHWRRGHVRVLQSGKAIVVRPHPVGGRPENIGTYVA